MRPGLVIAICAAVVIGGYSGLRAVSQDNVTLGAQMQSMQLDFPSQQPEPPAPPADLGRETLRRAMPATPMPAEPMTRGLDFTQQQQIGTICETANGFCQVAPAPILSVCYCGSDVGTITR